MRRHAGFTMIEVMIVVAIVAILAAIAYPGYSDYVRRGKIAEALGTLAETRAKMEQFYLDNRTYLGSDAANMPCDATVLNNGKRHFTYACANLGLNTYQVNANGNATEGMNGFGYTVNEQNQRTSTITASGWTGNATCWVIKKGGVC